jgi:hypothetical protein
MKSGAHQTPEVIHSSFSQFGTQLQERKNTLFTLMLHTEVHFTAPDKQTAEDILELDANSERRPELSRR